MGEPSSFRKGLNFGCGVIAALVFVFVGLPLACVFLGGTYSSFEGEVAQQVEDDRRAPAPAPEEAPVEPATDCGRLIGGYDSAGNRRPEAWSSWVCASEESAGERWGQCLQRRQYTWAGVGCPGEQRCCPPRPNEGIE